MAECLVDLGISVSLKLLAYGQRGITGERRSIRMIMLVVILNTFRFLKDPLPVSLSISLCLLLSVTHIISFSFVFTVYRLGAFD